MKLVTPAALALTLVTALAAAPPAEAQAPVAGVPKPVVDVGLVTRGEPIVHEFAIHNAGDADLEITEVKPACGCTVASYASRIEPGRTGLVRTVLETDSFNGPIAKSVTVFTNDPANPRLLLVIKANVRAQVEVKPAYARFVVIDGESWEPTVHEISASQGSDFRVTKVDSPFPFLKADYRKVGEGEEARWELKLTLSPEAPIGPMADFLVVHTDHPEQKQVRLPVSGFVRPPLVVVPQVYDFGERQVEEPYPGRVEVKVVGSRPVALGEVTTDLEGVEVEIEEVTPGKLYNLVIRLTPGIGTGPTEGLVSIATDNPRFPTLEVPIRGTVL